MSLSYRLRFAGIPLLLLMPVLAVAAPVPAAPAAAITAMPAPALPLADSFSWHGFMRYWKGFVNRADRVVLVVVLVAAAALFIITRGKWMK
jgi:hypothetical protein